MKSIGSDFRTPVESIGLPKSRFPRIPVKPGPETHKALPDENHRDANDALYTEGGFG